MGKGTKEEFAGKTVFGKLPEGKWDELFKAVEHQVAAPRTIIFRQGDPGDRFYVVRSGKVRVFRKDAAGLETDLSVLGPWESFGEMALLTGRGKIGQRGSDRRDPPHGPLQGTVRAHSEGLPRHHPRLRETDVRMAPEGREDHREGGPTAIPGAPGLLGSILSSSSGWALSSRSSSTDPTRTAYPLLQPPRQQRRSP